MPIIKRADGAQFAIHTYRELLSSQKPSFLRNEIRLLAQNHGEYARLFKQTNKTIEAVFSSDPGFLLGETAWQYFGKPSDLVYCEALPESQQAIVVIIKSNTVYLDTKIPFSNIGDEFAPLLTGNNQYDIYISGDVPVSVDAEPGNFVFDRSYVRSFTQLDTPVFNILPLDQAFQLQPLEVSLRSISPPVSSKAITISVLVLIIILGWWYFQKPKEIAVPVKMIKPKATAPKVVPFASFENSMNSPSPAQQLANMATIVDKLYNLQGWSATAITLANNSYTITVQSNGADLSTLAQWATTNNFDMTITAAGATLFTSVNLPNRVKPDAVPDLKDVIISVMDRLNHLLPSPSIQLGQTTVNGATRQASVSLQFNQISPDVLSLIGIAISAYPVVMTSVNAKLTQGLLSGTITMNLLGK